MSDRVSGWGICLLGLIMLGACLSPPPAHSISLEVLPDQSHIQFKGYSTLHNFVGKTSRVYGYVRGLDNLDFQQLSDRPRTHFHLTVRELSTDNESRDKEMYELLQSKRFPRIQYDLTRVSPVESSDTTFLLDARGTLSVAGETHPVRTRIRGKKTSKETVSLHTSFSVKMTDFGITPPSFMWMVKTEDRVDVSVHLLTRPVSPSEWIQQP